MYKFYRLVAATSVSMLAMVSHASADPISIGSFVISAMLATGTAGILPVVSAAAIGNFVIGAAVVGASLLAGALRQRPRVNPGEFKNTFEHAEAPEVRAIGRVRLGGLKAFGNTTGSDVWRVVCHSRGPTSAVEEHYLGGREVIVDPDGWVSSPPWARTGTPPSWARVRTKVGTANEVAWAELIADFPDLWTSNHRLRGISQSLIRYRSPGMGSENAIKKFQQLYSGGMPEYERVQRAEPIYDPRQGSQSATNPSTWAWGDNGVLGATHILRSYPSIKVDDLDFADIAVEASKADVTVAKLGGTERRSRCWGAWSSEMPRGDVMQSALDSIGAEIVPTDDNKYTIRLIDDVRDAEITIPARHIIDLQWRSGPESVERPNVCRLKYYSPERNYELAEIDLSNAPWARVQEEIDRVGEQFYDLELPFCPSASQAQRIARRLFALARADAGIVTANWAGMAAWGLSMADIELPDLDETVRCAIANPRVNDSEGTVEIPFVVWPDLEPWNPATMEVPAPEQLPDMQYSSSLPTPPQPGNMLAVQYPGGAWELRIPFTTASAPQQELAYRTYQDNDPDLPDNWVQVTDMQPTRGYVAGDFRGDRVSVRSRIADNSEDEVSHWSPVRTNDPIVVNNTSTNAPSVSFSGDPQDTAPSYFANVTVPAAEFRAVRLTMEVKTNPLGDFSVIANVTNLRPPQTVQITMPSGSQSDPQTIEWRTRSYVSNGTAGTFAQGAYVIPGTGGGT